MPSIWTMVKTKETNKIDINIDRGCMKQMTASRAATCANKALGKDKFSLVCFFNSRNCASVASWNWKISSSIQFYTPFNTALSTQLSLSVIKYFLLKNNFFLFLKNVVAYKRWNFLSPALRTYKLCPTFWPLCSTGLSLSYSTVMICTINMLTESKHTDTYPSNDAPTCTPNSCVGKCHNLSF